MKNQSDLNDQTQIDLENEQTNVFAMFSEHLLTMSPSQSTLNSLERHLGNRIQTSVTKHAGLRTIRSRAGTWLNLVKGIRYKSLWQSQQGSSVLIEFAPGSALPLHRHQYLEEGIVLSGILQLDELELNQFDYHVSPVGSCHGRIRSEQGALAFLRGSSVGQPMSMLKEVLGGLLPKNHKHSESILSEQGEWIETQKGYFQKVLWTDGTVASRFIRIDPGSTVEGHPHPFDEETMALSGEVFLGDILVQQGDYQIASAGSAHLEMSSDTGCLLFVRGAA